VSSLDKLRSGSPNLKVPNLNPEEASGGDKAAEENTGGEIEEEGGVTSGPYQSRERLKWPPTLFQTMAVLL
jgi:hypothetical protein